MNTNGVSAPSDIQPTEEDLSAVVAEAEAYLVEPSSGDANRRYEVRSPDKPARVRPALFTKCYADSSWEIVNNYDADLKIRIMELGKIRVDALQYARFGVHEIPQLLPVVNPKTGELGPPSKGKVQRAINSLVRDGVLQEGSDRTCLKYNGVTYEANRAPSRPSV